MLKSNIRKLMFLLFLFLCWGNLLAQDTSNPQKIKVVLSEKLAQKGITLYDYSVRTIQSGNMETYICFTSNRPLSNIVLNIFDKEDHILYQVDEVYRTFKKDEFKNMAYLYHCYIYNFDSYLIKTIVVDQE